MRGPRSYFINAAEDRSPGTPPPSAGCGSVNGDSLERSPRGAKEPRLSEEDEDKDSVAGSE